MTIRVVLADDQTLIRAGFRVLIEAENDLEVVGEAADGATAIDVVRSIRADVILMYIRMPGVDGIEATRRITTSSKPSEPGPPDSSAKVLNPSN